MRRERASAYQRQVLNEFASSSSQFVDLNKWDRCVHPELGHTHADLFREVFVGVDASVKHDSSAIVVVSFDRSAQMVQLCTHRIFQPTPEQPLDFELTIEAYLLDLKRRFQVRSVLFDPYQMQSTAQRLAKGGLSIEEFPQSSPNLTAASQNLFELINSSGVDCLPRRGDALGHLPCGRHRDPERLAHRQGTASVQDRRGGRLGHGGACGGKGAGRKFVRPLMVVGRRFTNRWRCQADRCRACATAPAGKRGLVSVEADELFGSARCLRCPMGQAMSKRPQSKQSHAGAFCVQGGVVVAGRDPIVSLLELPTPNGFVHDLLKTGELPDGWFVVCADGVTRRPTGNVVPPPRQHQRPVPRRVRPAIRAQRSVRTLHGSP